MHSTTLIATIAAGFTGAWLLGLITQRLGLSPIVGYILAGVIIGPHTPGFVGDLHAAQQLAELGVILLMFGVGLHFQMKELLAVKSVAIPGAVGQSLIATLVAMLIFSLFGFDLKTGMVIGMAMAVASTVVLMRVLMDADVLSSTQGHIAVGWLIVEDIFTVVLLVIIPIMGSDASKPSTEGGMSIWMLLGMALLKLSALVALLMVVGVRIIPWALVQVARLRSRELFTLTILVFSIAIAAGSYFFFGASMALGAFLAGMVVAQSPLSHQAAADALPMRDAFAVLFFVSVGMIFDPRIIIDQPLLVLAGLTIILVVKPLSALVIIAVLGHSPRTALTVAIGLAQIGEFSFILSDLAKIHGLMPDSGHNLLVGSAIISIALNPLLFRYLPQMEQWLKSKPWLWQLLNNRAEKRALASNLTAMKKLADEQSPTTRLAIVVGYGPVGRSVHRLLQDAGLRTVVVDLNMDTVTSLNQSGQTAIYGDAAHETIMTQAGIKQASHLVLTLPHSTDRAAIVALCREMNPALRILVRARYLREREDLEQAGATAAVFEEVEAAVALARLVLADTGMHREAADRKINDLRLQLIMENVSNIRSQRVRSIMVPWSRVRWLTLSMDRHKVMSQVAQERFSRWPVVDTATGKPQGYLLTKDLIADAVDADWSRLVRPLKVIHPDDSIDTALSRMQEEVASVYLVADNGNPVGLITLEDILEQVVGQIEDEYPHEPAISLISALTRGAVVLEVASPSGTEVIKELIQEISEHHLPAGVSREKLVQLVLKRESELSTDLGNGVAIPHARCPDLSAPILVLGRSVEGIMYSPSSTVLVQLIFLIITPEEQPEVQLRILSQLAGTCRVQSNRDLLLKAESPADVFVVMQKVTPA